MARTTEGTALDARAQPSPLGERDRRERLLLIEDSPFQAKMLEGMVRTGGLDVVVEHAASLAEAREALRDDGRVACVVLDLTLPDASGLDGVVEMAYAAPEAPLVVVTADEDEARAVKAVQLGAQDYLIKGRIDAQLLRRSIRYAMERKRSELHLAHQALHDALTGLPNRSLLFDRLQLALAQCERRPSLVAVFFCDLDGFKSINDTHGHAAGDRVLCAAAGRLLSAVRPGDTVARYGGDEFTVISADIAGESDAVSIAQRLRDAISQPFPIRDGEVVISTSVGIALATGLAQRPADVVQAADEAMYAAKSTGAPYSLVKR